MKAAKAQNWALEPQEKKCKLLGGEVPKRLNNTIKLSFLLLIISMAHYYKWNWNFQVSPCRHLRDIIT
jgi:hypothetical protein